MYQAKIIADSVAQYRDQRLTTMEVTFPRIILSEFNTHRMFSRNSASSRAIPVEKQIQKVLTDPFIPIYWGKNQKGMSADQELTLEEQDRELMNWLWARDRAVEAATEMMNGGVHKQITNRLIEAWQWQTCIVTATEWSNFFALRCAPTAQPEIRKIAIMMRDLYNESVPNLVEWHSWHLPYIDNADRQAFKKEIEVNNWENLCNISAARCARVSYLTHDGKRDYDADLQLFDKLVGPGHMSPLEHVAAPSNGWHGNFNGWKQLRKFYPNEDDYSKVGINE